MTLWIAPCQRRRCCFCASMNVRKINYRNAQACRDCTIRAQCERQYGKARRVWLMDRGVPTEEVLAEMRAADPPVH